MNRINIFIISAIIILFILNIFSIHIGHCAYRDSQIKKFFDTGDKLIKEGKYSEALGQYQEALKLNTEDAECNFKVGVAYYFLNNFPEAISAYKKAIDLNPKHFKALNNLALIYEKQDEDMEATMLYEKAIKANPEYRIARYNLGVVLYKRDKIEKAEEVARELVKLHPDYDKSYYLLGLIQESGEKYDEAKASYEKALSLAPGNTDAADGLKRLKSKIEMTNAKKEEMETALKIAGFKLPPGYEFQKIINLESGAKVIHVRYKEEQDLYIVRFPDAHVLRERDIKTIINEPVEDFSKFLKEMKISDLSVLEIKEFPPEDPVRIDTEGGRDEKGKKPVRIDEDEGKKVDEKDVEKTRNVNLEYARVTCKINDKEHRGIMNMHPIDGEKGPILFIAVSPGDKFSLSIARKFLIHVGVPR